jgi:ADP-ribosylglycohydrolase
MYGAVIGDVCGSIYEFNNHKTEKPETIDLLNPYCTYTDDTVLTCAVAEAAFGDHDYEGAILKWARRYPRESYGYNFKKWFLSDEPQPYDSFGNGSAMRVSAVGYAFDSLKKTRAEARRSAECTHNHPEGLKGAEAVAAAIFLARTGKTKDQIKAFVQTEFAYDLSLSLDQIRPGYEFDESCQGTVPQAITSFLESRDFPHAIQCAISLGGDSDTLAAITGGLAEAFYDQRYQMMPASQAQGRLRIPGDLSRFAKEKMTPDMQAVLGKIYFDFTVQRVNHFIETLRQRHAAQTKAEGEKEGKGPLPPSTDDTFTP